MDTKTSVLSTPYIGYYVTFVFKRYSAQCTFTEEQNVDSFAASRPGCTHGSRLTGVASVIRGRTGGVISELAGEGRKKKAAHNAENPPPLVTVALET